jgi:hypothetical protein
MVFFAPPACSFTATTTRAPSGDRVSAATVCPCGRFRGRRRSRSRRFFSCSSRNSVRSRTASSSARSSLRNTSAFSPPPPRPAPCASTAPDAPTGGGTRMSVNCSSDPPSSDITYRLFCRVK